MPLIVDWPGVTKPGSVCDTPVISMDLYPTIAEAAGAPEAVQNAQDGVDLAPLLHQNGRLKRDELFWHYPHYQHYQLGGTTPYSAIRKGDFKLIEFFDDMRVELYNLRDDIGEKRNLRPRCRRKSMSFANGCTHGGTRLCAQMPTRNAKYDPSKPEHDPAKDKKPAGKEQSSSKIRTS